MHLPSPNCTGAAPDLGTTECGGYLSAGILLHAITALELTAILLVVGLDHPVPKVPTLIVLGLMVLFTQLDARSRFQEFKRIRDQLIRYGPDRRIFRSIAASRCQRDAGLAAADQLGYAAVGRRWYRAMGYRWYHLLPDFVCRHPGYLISPAFLRTTFFLSTYTSRFPATMGAPLRPSDTSACQGSRQ